MANKKPIDVETLWKLERIGSVSLSPDGTAAVCAVTSYSMQDNKGSTSLWLLPTNAKSPRRLTRAGDKDASPTWSPKGDRIAFLAKREQEGRKDAERQLYVIAAAGGEAERKSNFGPGIDEFKWMPDGRRVAFVSWVWPHLKGSRAQEKAHKAFSERKESAYVTSEPQYRHFDKNLPMGRVPHLMLLDLDSGRVNDLFEGSDYELPRFSPCAAHFDISPDGRRIAFSYDAGPRKSIANPQALAEIDVATRKITALPRDAAWSYDAPRYSPSGTQLACIAANVGKRHTMPGRVAITSGGKAWKILGDDSVLDVDAPLRWTTDGGALLFKAQEQGRCHLWHLDLANEKASIAVQGGWVQEFAVAGETVVVAIDSAQHPVQMHAIRAGQAARRLERFNDALMARVALGETREVKFKGARNDEVQMFLTLPPGFDAKKKYPLLHVIHGGPYAAAGDTWGYRWNAQALASRGHVVAAVNYHGSSGFGFAFRDSIVGQQGQLETDDIEAASDWLLRQPWVDARRLFASGGSYGGFLVAWMNGHVKAGRYRAYVCHAGVFDRIATFCADSFTDRPKDLGALFWENPAKVLAQSPHSAAQHMDTPTLIIHGTNDYRVPDCNGLAYYNTLQTRGVAARLVWFPDENHWVLKPRNSRLWYGEFFNWLREHDLGRPSSAPARRSARR